jgi:hypothetical protein
MSHASTSSRKLQKILKRQDVIDRSCDNCSPVDASIRNEIQTEIPKSIVSRSVVYLFAFSYKNS